MVGPARNDPTHPDHKWWFCSVGTSGHNWIYRRDTGSYRCLGCGFVTSKADLKLHTDKD